MKKTTDPKVALLRELPSLISVPERQLASVAPLVEDLRVAAGAVLLAEGATCHEVLLVLEGVATISTCGRRQGSVGPGNVLGDVAVRDGVPHASTVTADTPMHLLVAGPESFRAFVRHPVVTRTAATGLSARLRHADVGT